VWLGGWLCCESFRGCGLVLCLMAVSLNASERENESLHAALQDISSWAASEVVGVYLDHELVEVLNDIFELS
jgi:hypothetical protein